MKNKILTVGNSITDAKCIAEDLAEKRGEVVQRISRDHTIETDKTIYDCRAAYQLGAHDLRGKKYEAVYADGNMPARDVQPAQQFAAHTEHTMVILV